MFAHEKAIRTLHLKGNLCLHLKNFCLIPEKAICALSLKKPTKKGKHDVSLFQNPHLFTFARYYLSTTEPNAPIVRVLPSKTLSDVVHPRKTETFKACTLRGSCIPVML